MSKPYQYLFGPVPSRRLGRSLGVDLIPFKTCTMNCTFCQLGETTCEVSERGDYVPMQEVLSELGGWLSKDGQADHITLAGSGEPTLHLGFGDVLRWVKANTTIASVLLTNGSLLHLPEVREGAALADKVKVTLSAWDEASFQQVHRPAQGVTFDLLVKGERAFREAFAGELSVEVFIVEGVNSDAAQARRIAEIVESIHPDRIDINAAVRPPADSDVRAPCAEHLQGLADVFGPNAVVTAPHLKPGEDKNEITADGLLGIIQRHPATTKQLAADFNAAVDTVAAVLNSMVEEGRLSEERRGGEIYYVHRAAD